MNLNILHCFILQYPPQLENRNLKALTSIKLKNRNQPIIAQLNINSIRKNFDFLCSEISPNLDLLLVSETKLDLFPTVHKKSKFLMSGFCKLFRLDRCSNCSGCLLCIREDYHLVYLVSINHLKM